MNGVAKGMLLMLVFLYIVSPLDLCPGPVDDLIMLMVGIAAQKRIGKGETQAKLYRPHIT